MRNALIIAAEERLPYRILRCAAPLFERVYVLATDAASKLANSRMCTGYFRHPRDIFTAADIHTIEKLSEMLSIDCILPADGHTTEFLAEVGHKLTSRIYPLPTVETFRILNDKESFARLCADLDIPIPHTRLFESSAELKAATEAGKIHYPYVIKPIRMSGGSGVKKITSPSSLHDIVYQPVLTQAFVDGREICAFYFCWKGQILAEVAYQHETHSLVFVRHHEIDYYAARIIKHFGFHGVIGFDVIERADKSIAFLECNPRFWYNMNFAMLGGLNFIEIGFSPEKAETLFIAEGTRLPKIASIISAASLLLCGSPGWKVLRYHLADIGQGWGFSHIALLHNNRSNQPMAEARTISKA